MQPIIDIAGLELPAYRTFTIVALLAGIVIMVMARRSGTSRALAGSAAVAALAGGLLGARLFAASTAVEPFQGGVGSVLTLRFGHMAMFGGLLGAGLAGLIVARLSGQTAERIGDSAAPAIAVGIVLLRVGCLLAGCCFGRPTGMPWGVTYPLGSEAHFHQLESGGSLLGVLGGVEPVHPIPVYEMIAAAVLALAAFAILRRNARDGTALAVVVAGYAVARLVIHPFRALEPGITPEWFDPAMYAILALSALVWLGRPRLRANRQPERKWTPAAADTGRFSAAAEGHRTLEAGTAP